MIEPLEARIAPAGLVISEILFNPDAASSDDLTREYVELRGEPGATIPAGTYFVQIEGDASSNNGQGDVDVFFDLSGLTLGSAGFLVITQAGAPWDTELDPRATHIRGTTSGFAGIPGFAADSSGAFADGSGTFFLIQTDTPLSLSNDIDPNNDGVADGAVFDGWRLLDAIGFLDGGGANNFSYAALTYRAPGDPGAADGTIVDVPFNVGYLGRQLLSTGSQPQDWVASKQIAPDGNGFRLSAAPDTTPGTLPSTAIDHLGAINFPPPVKISPNGRVATYTDADGDRVKVKIGTGTLTAGDFITAGRGIGRELLRLDLSGSLQPAPVTDLRIIAEPGANGGDGRVFIGELKADDLRMVTIDGDVGALDIGNVLAPAPAFKVLQLGSLTGPHIGASFSVISGDAGILKLSGDLNGELVANGKINEVRIRGSIAAEGSEAPARLTATEIRTLMVGGSVVGDTQDTGQIRVNKVGSVLIRGSLVGGDGNRSGTLDFDTVETFRILGSITGGDVDLGLISEAGRLLIRDRVTDVFIGGSIIGGDSLFPDGPSFQVVAPASGKVTIGGSLVGGTEIGSGTLFAGSPNSLVIRGGIFGGQGERTGRLEAEILGNALIGGSVIGGAGFESGELECGKADSLSIGGDFRAGSTPGEAQLLASHLGRLRIKGDVVGSELHPLVIAATNFDGAGFGRIVIDGSVRHAVIMTETKFRGELTTIGSVRVRGDFLDSHIAVSVDPGDDNQLGTADDVIRNLENRTAIRSVIIQGRAGSLTTDGLASIQAQRIGNVEVRGILVGLDALDPDDRFFGSRHDLRVRESFANAT